MSKVNPCACGICGHPVVRVPAGEEPFDGWTRLRSSWEDWRSYGHFYVAGQLVRVRCETHAESWGGSMMGKAPHKGVTREEDWMWSGGKVNR